jgi:hypothetical protein
MYTTMNTILPAIVKPTNIREVTFNAADTEGNTNTPNVLYTVETALRLCDTMHL